MAIINKLTPAQERLLPEWHERWLRIGMCEQPIDRELARDAIRRAYATVNKPEPLIVFCESPATSNLGVAVWPHLFSIKLRASLWASLRASLGASLGDSLGASLGDSLRASLWASLRASLGASLGDSLRASLRASLGASLGDSLRDSLWDSLGASLGDSLRASLRASLGDSYLWGQHDAYWIAFYEFGAEIGVAYKPEERVKLTIMADLARSCGWIYFYENVCFVSGRPKVNTEIIERNGRKVHQLHCASGPAMSFADGYAIWAWHGTRVPRDVIEKPESITPQLILAERNAEIRRVMIERYGVDRFVLDAGAKLLDCSGDNELLAIDLPSDPDGRLVALKLRCPSTSAVYVLRVPPDQTTVKSALAWTFGMTANEYVLAAEA